MVEKAKQTFGTMLSETFGKEAETVLAAAVTEKSTSWMLPDKLTDGLNISLEILALRQDNPFIEGTKQKDLSKEYLVMITKDENNNLFKVPVSKLLSAMTVQDLQVADLKNATKVNLGLIQDPKSLEENFEVPAWNIYKVVPVKYKTVELIS